MEAGNDWDTTPANPSVMLLLLLLARQNVCTLHSLFFVFFCSSPYRLSVICVESSECMRISIPQSKGGAPRSLPLCLCHETPAHLKKEREGSAEDCNSSVWEGGQWEA